MKCESGQLYLAGRIDQNEQQNGLTRAQVTDGHRDLATKDNAQGTKHGKRLTSTIILGEI